ncbi:nuclear factor 1 X-type isoform X2, partial [Brachionus plicatilis]
MDYDQSFIDKLLPHVKSFAFTWFHLQAAKRKHFKNEDKRMSYDHELRLKQQFQNEKPGAKLKWAIRLLMKLRKDVHRLNQKDLIDVITGAKPTNECVLSNPDMKGKMRRIDCLRQSDKVWRLDLVMVVLFKGIPLESSDGERLDKLVECKHPTLCINPNHALLNVRDLEVFLANYINNSYKLTNSQSNALLYQNIRSSNVFTPQEFLTLSEVSIVNGATESDIKNQSLIAERFKLCEYKLKKPYETYAAPLLFSNRLELTFAAGSDHRVTYSAALRSSKTNYFYLKILIEVPKDSSFSSELWMTNAVFLSFNERLKLSRSDI